MLWIYFLNVYCSLVLLSDISPVHQKLPIISLGMSDTGNRLARHESLTGVATVTTQVANRRWANVNIGWLRWPNLSDRNTTLGQRWYGQLQLLIKCKY